MAYIGAPIADTKTFTEEYAFHGLKKDSSGLLTYTKVLMASDDSVSVTEGDGIAYGGLEDLQINLDKNGDNNNLTLKGITPDTVLAYENDIGKRSYDQIRFDENKLFYYMNEQGYLVARYLKNFIYESQTGATRNWRS
jgi:hypothetical protein